MFVKEKIKLHLLSMSTDVNIVLILIHIKYLTLINYNKFLKNVTKYLYCFLFTFCLFFLNPYIYIYNFLI